MREEVGNREAHWRRPHLKVPTVRQGNYGFWPVFPGMVISKSISEVGKRRLETVLSSQTLASSDRSGAGSEQSGFLLAV